MIWILILGCFMVGAIFGVVLMAILQAGAQADKHIEKMNERRQ